jgi:acetoin utilization deacetylase AcuC-like enzyme
MIRIAWHTSYAFPLGDGHKFPMRKYDLIKDILLAEKTITADQLFEPGIILRDLLKLTHDEGYLQSLFDLNLTEIMMRRIGFPFPLTKSLLERELIIMQGTVDCAMYSLEHGCALNIAGGTHHAFTNKGEGFCILNDFAIASNYLLQLKPDYKILICDLDVHQGNGTAEIFSDHKNVFTFSMHGAGNYPFRKERSDLDIGLTDGTEDEEYLDLLEKNFFNIVDSFMPDFIFYLPGADILSTDKYGRLKITREGCMQRDKFVLEQCFKKGIPVACALGGGYSPDIHDIAEAHCNTFRIAKKIFG